MSFVFQIIRFVKILFFAPVCKTEVKKCYQGCPSDQCFRHQDIIVQPTISIYATGFQKPQLIEQWVRTVARRSQPPFGHSSIQRRLNSMQLAHSNQSRRRGVQKSATSPPESDTVQIVVFQKMSFDANESSLDLSSPR